MVSPAVWERAEEAVEPYFANYDRHLRPPLSWLDPAPDRTFCIRWWGDKAGVEDFKEWSRTAYGVLRQHPELSPALFVPPVRPVPPAWVFTFEQPVAESVSGYYWTANALVGWVTKNPQLTRTKEHRLFDVPHSAECAAIPTKQRRLDEDDVAEQPPVKVLFLELEADAITLALRLLYQLTTGELPSLQVDRKNGVIYLKGTPVRVDPFQAQFVAVIVAANGGWVSGNEIRRQLKLSEGERIDRTIFAKLPQQVREQIETKQGKGYRLRISTVANSPPISE
jgi:biotin operon repressor